MKERINEWKSYWDFFVVSNDWCSWEDGGWNQEKIKDKQCDIW